MEGNAPTGKQRWWVPPPPRPRLGLGLCVLDGRAGELRNALEESGLRAAAGR